MTGVGPYQTIPWLLLPVLLIVAHTSVAIIRKPYATVEWVLSAALRAMPATGLYVLVMVSVFTLVVQ